MSIQIDNGELEYWEMPESAIAWSKEHDKQYAELVSMRSIAGKRLEAIRKEARKCRDLIVERDGAKCQACGTPDRLTVDHILPLSKGGTNDFANLQLLCRSCNSVKGGK